MTAENIAGSGEDGEKPNEQALRAQGKRLSSRIYMTGSQAANAVRKSQRGGTDGGQDSPDAKDVFLRPQTPPGPIEPSQRLLLEGTYTYRIYHNKALPIASSAGQQQSQLHIDRGKCMLCTASPSQ
jgi:hypothetical protein